MKKVYLSLVLAACVVGAASAQQSAGGFPLSSEIVKVQDQKVAQIEFSRPDYEGIMKKNAEDERKGVAKPYMVATLLPSDISLANSGTWTYLNDGRKIWRLTISVPDAKGVGLYYDQFTLPKGVQLFVSNENGAQTLGAYTAANNDNRFGKFANVPVAGSVANLEMDIPADVAIENIVFHLNQVAAYYRGVDIDFTIAHPTPAKPTGVVADPSAPCHVDANCPLPSFAPHDFEMQKNASVKITIRSQSGNTLGFCSGTLINNTANSAGGTCTPLLLTASHCDEENSFDDSHFSQWIFWFNYRYDSCGGNNVADPSGLNTTMIGADFKARSYFPSMPSPAGSGTFKLVGDFLLLQLQSRPPANLGTYLLGWNRNLDLALNTDKYNFFIGYHYPKGAPEKRSIGYTIQSNGTFNQNQVTATHWYIPFTDGGSEPGSSGSGLFDVDGRIVGDLSGGNNAGCNNNPIYYEYGTEGLYSKISYNWENDYDQINHPRPAGQESQSRLKDWLDPNNTGAYTTDAVKPDCTPTTGINDLGQEMGNNIEIYPTPSTTGIIHAKTKFTKPTNLKIAVYNAVGQLVKQFTITGAYDGDYSFDCSQLANGLYVMKFVSQNATTAKKVLIAR